MLILYPLDGRDDIWMNIRPAPTWERISLPQEYRNKSLLMFGRGDSSIVASVRRDARTTVVLHSRDYGRSWTVELETGAEHRGRVLYTTGDTAVVYDARDKVLNLRSPSGAWSVSALIDSKPVERWTAGSAIVVRSDTTFYRSLDGVAWASIPAGFISGTSSGADYKDAMTGLPNGDVLHIVALGDEHDRIRYWTQGTGRWTISNDSLPMSLEAPFAISSTAIIAADESGPMISKDKGARWLEGKTGIATTPMRTYSIGKGSVIAVSIYGDVYYGDTKTGKWTERRLMSLPRRLGRDSIIDIVQTLRGTFAVKTRDIGVVRLLDTMEWSVVWNYHGSTVGFQSSSRFFKSPTDGMVYTVLPHVIVVTLDGSSWYPSYTNNDVVMTSVTAYALQDFRIGIDTSIYTLNSGGGARYLFKVWDIGEPFELVSQGVWDTFHMATISGQADRGILRCARAQIGVQGPLDRYEVELGSPVDPLYFDFAMASSGNVYVTTPKGLYLLRAYGQEIERMPEEGPEMGLALEWNETYGLTRCSTRGLIEYAADVGGVSVRRTTVPVGKRCAVYPNPASEHVAIQVSEMDGDAIIDVVNAVFSRRMAIVVGRASPGVTSLPSGTSASP